MRQATLDEFIRKTESEETRCHICGIKLKNKHGLTIHMRKAHGFIPDMYPGERVEFKSDGYYVKLSIRMKRSLWDDIRRRAIEWGLPVRQLIFKSLSNLASFGLDYKFYYDDRGEPTYIK